MLVLDDFPCHTIENVKSTLKRYNTNLVIIPGGMTSIVQQMDVVVSKPFKAALKYKLAEWVINGEHIFTKGGNTRNLDRGEGIQEYVRRHGRRHSLDGRR